MASMNQQYSFLDEAERLPGIRGMRNVEPKMKLGPFDRKIIHSGSDSQSINS